MYSQRQTDSKVADMTGAGALPRRSGELVFHEAWERRAFALAVALNQDGKFDWEEFRHNLISAIELSESESQAPKYRPTGYYEQWLTALEETLAANSIIIPANEHSKD
ncbi:MAG: nitrile hydratase accessory protein [Gammaproteobacteria bacterium]